MSATSHTESNASPKYRRVYDEIRSRILAGVYPAGSKLPTEVDLPKMLGASKPTVVRALSDLVRDGFIVRRRRSGTFVSENRDAQPLKEGRTLHIGVLWHRSVFPDRMRETFQGDITQGLLEGMDLTAAADLETHWPQVQPDQPTRAEWSSRVRGIRVTCLGEARKAWMRHPPLETVAAGGFDIIVTLSIVERDFLLELEKLNVPLILADVCDHTLRDNLKSADRVVLDPGAGYHAAVERFAAAGLRRIHFVAEQINTALPPGSTDTRPGRRVDPESYARFAAYQQAMAACGLAVAPDAVHFENLGGDALVKQFMALPKNKRPEALVCHSWGRANQLAQTLSAAGSRVVAAGTSHRPQQGGAHCIVAHGRPMGKAIAEFVRSRVERPKRSGFCVAVPMEFEAAPADLAVASSDADRGGK